MSNDHQLATLIENLEKERIDSALCVIRIGMEIVETHNVNGETKSLMVIDMLKKLLEKQDIAKILPYNVRNGIKVMLDANLVSSVMPIICDASKGKLKVNEPKSCLSTMFGMFGSGKTTASLR